MNKKTQVFNENLRFEKKNIIYGGTYMADRYEILCYGDSNTWGTIGRWTKSDEPSERFDENTRWTSVLQNELGESFHVISEGLGGRTTIYPVKGEEWKNGEAYLTPCLLSHRPLDLVIIMLGTNDLHLQAPMTMEALPAGITRLNDIVQSLPKAGRGNQPAKILVIAPVEVRPSAPNGRTEVYRKFHGDEGRRISLSFPEVYEKIAREKGCYFLNAQDFAEPCPADGVHMDKNSHIRLGKAIAKFIQNEIK